MLLREEIIGNLAELADCDLCTLQTDLAFFSLKDVMRVCSEVEQVIMLLRNFVGVFEPKDEVDP